MLEMLSVGLIVTGLALALGLLYVHRETQQYVGLAARLIDQRAQIGSDALAWFEQAESALRAAGVDGLHYDGLWFASPIHGGWGAARANPRCQSVHVGEMELHYRITLGRTRGERQVLREGLLRVFDLLLEQSVLSKSEAIAAALSQQAELSLYLQHDMKNLTQWVLLLTEQFEFATAESLPLLAEQLREHAPLARRKAERLVDAMSRRQPADPPPGALRLQAEARIFAGFHGVILDQTGDPGTLCVSRLQLERILDGLFASFAAHAVRQPVALHIDRVGDTIEATFQQIRTNALPATRVFEPLAGGRINGTGLGLHQARLAARVLGGALIATHSPDHSGFKLTLPAMTLPTM